MRISGFIRNKSLIVLGLLIIIAPITFRAGAQENNLKKTRKKIFELKYTHPGKRAQSTAVIDLNKDGKNDLVIAAKNNIYLVKNEGNFIFKHEKSMSMDNANGWGMHDFNQDGLMDLFVGQAGKANGHKDTLINRGNFNFKEIDAGNENIGPVRNTVFADFDGDGNIDSFNSASAFRDNHAGCQFHPGLKNGKFGPDIIRKILNPDIPDFWYDTANPPNGNEPEQWASKQMKGVVVRDFDLDGKPDIICGSYADIGFPESEYALKWVESHDRGVYVLQNQSKPGNFQFKEIAKKAIGDFAYGNKTNESWNVYCIIPFDYNRDGLLDIFIGTKVRSWNSELIPEKLKKFYLDAGFTETPSGELIEDTVAVRFFKNVSVPGRIQFVDKTAEVGFDHFNQDELSIRAQRSFASGQAIDIDNDGWQDLVLTNRISSKSTNYNYVHIFRNTKDNSGQRIFKEISKERHGLADGGGGRDLVCEDLDEDGKVDIVINDGSVGGYTAEDNTRFYKNQLTTQNNWLKVKVVKNNNVAAIGTRIEIKDPGTRQILGVDELRTDFCYRSKRTPAIHFGLGNLDKVNVSITDRNGNLFSYPMIEKNQTFVIDLSKEKQAPDEQAQIEPVDKTLIKTWLRKLSKKRNLTPQELKYWNNRLNQENADIDQIKKEFINNYQTEKSYPANGGM
jgi:hypothetical protein